MASLHDVQLVLQKKTEPVSCSKDARYFVITPIAMLDDATRVVSLAAEMYARCRLGRLSPAVGSPVLPDAPSLTLTPLQSAQAPSPLPPKSAVSKQSAAMQETLKRSLAQAQAQLAPAPSADKTSTEQKGNTLAAGGTSDATHNPSPPTELQNPSPPAEAAQRPAKVAQESLLTHKPGVLRSLSETYPAAEALMPRYGSSGSELAPTPGNPPGEKQKNNSDDTAKAQQPRDSERSELVDGRVWYENSCQTYSFEVVTQ